jgi:hypothetical protein
MSNALFMIRGVNYLPCGSARRSGMVLKLFIG